jgi:hypothetical protein
MWFVEATEITTQFVNTVLCAPSGRTEGTTIRRIRMDDNWAEVRRQLDQVLENERAQRQIRRQQQRLWWQVRGAWWSPARLFGTRHNPSKQEKTTLQPHLANRRHSWFGSLALKRQG